MNRLLILVLSFFVLGSSYSFADGYDGFRFLKRIRGLKLADSKVVEIKLEETQNDLVICYRERKVMYVSFVKLGSWDKVNDFRIDENVALYASYFDESRTDYYLNIDIYKLIYKKINIETGLLDTLECSETPRGCASVESMMYETEIRSADGYFIYVRDKDHPNDVLVYMDNIQFNNVKAEMEDALQREVYVREVKEKLENDARKMQLSESGANLKQVAEVVAAEPEVKKENFQITQEDILTLMTTGRFEKGGVVMTLSPGLKVKVDNSTVSTLDDPAETYLAGDIIELEAIVFDQGKSTLTESSFEELDKLAQLLSEKSSMHVQINGHTNNKGTNNMEISEDRAKAVYDYLISKGIGSDRLRYRGYGSTQPIASNNTEDGLAKNRRVEIEIVKQ